MVLSLIFTPAIHYYLRPKEPAQAWFRPAKAHDEYLPWRQL